MFAINADWRRGQRRGADLNAAEARTIRGSAAGRIHTAETCGCGPLGTEGCVRRLTTGAGGCPVTAFLTGTAPPTCRTAVIFAAGLAGTDGAAARDAVAVDATGALLTGAGRGAADVPVRAEAT